MDLNAIRQFVQDNPAGVVIRMVDGTEYPIPHRDHIWFTPHSDAPENRGTRLATSFYVSVDGVGKLVNAMVVREVVPMSVKPSRSKGRRKAG
jgi:hypothetical protein